MYISIIVLVMGRIVLHLIDLYSSVHIYTVYITAHLPLVHHIQESPKVVHSYYTVAPTINHESSWSVHATTVLD